MSHSVKSGPRGTFRHFPLAFCVLLLALSIFGWGLHSKLSQYHGHAEAQVVTPTAKLLSEQERPSNLQAQSGYAQPAHAPVIHAAALWAVMAAPPVYFARRWPRQTAVAVEPVAFSFDGPSLLRPPPSPRA